MQALARGVDVLVATPGRLLDLCQQKLARLDRVQALVLDEADRMLDLGFLPDVKRIVGMVPASARPCCSRPPCPTTSDRWPAGCCAIRSRWRWRRSSSTAEGVTQYVLFVGHKDKRHLLAEVLRDPAMTRALVFTRTKRGANRVAEHLEKSRVSVGVIHGNKSQNARVKALEAFKDGKARVLVATDIAARGIDVRTSPTSSTSNCPTIPKATSIVLVVPPGPAGGGGPVLLRRQRTHQPARHREIDRPGIRIVERHPYSGANRGGPQ